MISTFKELSLYLITALLCSLLLLITLELWRMDISAPFLYIGGDDIQHLSSAVKTDGKSHIPMPFRQIINFLTHDTTTAYNTYFLLSFVITALTALYVFRWCGVSYFSSIVGSTLFAFIPYNFFRGISHYTLSTATFLIPLAIIVILWMLERQSSLFSNPLKNMRQTIGIIASILIFIALPYNEIYYSFFACFLLLVGGLYIASDRGKLAPFFILVIFVFIATATVVYIQMPKILYVYEYGPNLAERTTATILRGRTASEAELYGLKIIQMLLPIAEHRMTAFSELAYRYRSGVVTTENTMASLGVVASLGFLSLLFVLLFRRKQAREHDRSERILDLLSTLNISLVLLGTIGGFGAIFALLVTSVVRGYNRVSIFIAFLSLLAFFMIYDNFFKTRIQKALAQKKKFKTIILKIVYPLLAIIIMILGILDQTSPRFIPNYEVIQKAWYDDQRFVQKIEQTVGQNAKIFQLPYMPYPEVPPRHSLPTYGLLRGQLHSNTLSWSYGSSAYKGTPADFTYRTIASYPLPKLLETITLLDFKGIYIDRRGYEAEEQKALENELIQLIGRKAFTNEAGFLAFYDISDYMTTLKKEFTDAELSQKKQAIDELFNPK